MERMTVNEVLEDISNRSGYSTSIVRAVLNAEAKSAEERLKRGERATLMGRVTLTPSFRQRLEIGGTIGKEIKIKASATPLENSLADISEFISVEEDTSSEAEFEIVKQISGLL